MSLRVEWLEDEERWRSQRREWDAAVDASARPSIFNTFDFLDVSWRHFARSRGNRLALLLIRDGETLVGFAALRRSERRRLGLSVRTLKRLASWESDRVPFCLPAGREEEAAAALLDALAADAAWDALELAENAPDDPFAVQARERASDSAGLALCEEEDSPSPYVRLEGTLDDYLAELGSSTRQKARRNLKKLQKRGSFELDATTDAEEMSAGLEGYLQVERGSWKVAEGQGIGKNARNVAFYRELLPTLARSRRAAVCLLRLEGRPIAGTIELQLGSRVYAPQWTFDSEFADLSPGGAIRLLCLERHVGRGPVEYELFARFLGDKLRWTKRTRPNQSFAMLRTGGVRRSLVFRRRLARRAQPSASVAEAC